MGTNRRSSADWRPRSGVDVARLRAALLDEARGFFHDNGILEIDAPVLCSAPVSDINIESIVAHSTLDANGQPHYLQTSPEYAMKRMLAAGFPDICFVGKVFRDGEAGRRHQPEFTMVEWYRLGQDLSAIMADTEAFIARLLDGTLSDAPPERLSYIDAFKDRLGIDPVESPVDSLADAADADPALRRALGTDRDAWLDLLLATQVAATFAPDRLTTVYHYPASQAALARINDADRRVAERFEVFAGEAELANGYVELTDPVEQRRRFDADQARRQASGRQPRPLDERFLAALASGLPDCAGVAVGFDRLLMLRAGAADIRDVRPFCWETA